MSGEREKSIRQILALTLQLIRTSTPSGGGVNSRFTQKSMAMMMMVMR
jgi:hypothetical protein